MANNCKPSLTNVFTLYAHRPPYGVEAALQLVAERSVAHFQLFVIDQHLDMTDGSLLGVDVIDRLRQMGARGVKILCTGSNGILSTYLGQEWDAVDLLWGKPLPRIEQMRRDLSAAFVKAGGEAGGGASARGGGGG